MLQIASGLRRSSARTGPNGCRDARQHAPVGTAEERKNRCHRSAELEQLIDNNRHCESVLLIIYIYIRIFDIIIIIIVTYTIITNNYL